MGTGSPARHLSKERRTAIILDGLANAFPAADCALVHRNAYELLVATILSAQCTDERVNMVTRQLFADYPTPADLAVASPRELERDIHSTGFFRNKAKSLVGASRMIIEQFGGRVPQTMEELVQLPGVARKTANVVLGVAFGKAEGIVVDTHVSRVSRRLELSEALLPEKIEQDLMGIIPRSLWVIFSHRMILHGRHVCKARKPLCGACTVRGVCRSPDRVTNPSSGRKTR